MRMTKEGRKEDRIQRKATTVASRPAPLAVAAPLTLAAAPAALSPAPLPVQMQQPLAVFDQAPVADLRGISQPPLIPHLPVFPSIHLQQERTCQHLMMQQRQQRQMQMNLRFATSAQHHGTSAVPRGPNMLPQPAGSYSQAQDIFAGPLTSDPP